MNFAGRAAAARWHDSDVRALFGDVIIMIAIVVLLAVAVLLSVGELRRTADAEGPAVAVTARPHAVGETGVAA